MTPVTGEVVWVMDCLFRKAFGGGSLGRHLLGPEQEKEEHWAPWF